MELGGGPVIVCLLMIGLLPPEKPPVVIDSFAKECVVRTISKQDTPQSQRERALDNARCRDARAKQQKK